MTITAEQVDLLNNRFGALAHKVQLGTLIQNAESVTAGEIALAEGKLLVGNASGVAAAATLTSAQILVGNSSSVATPVSVTGDVTISNTGVTAIGSGVIVNADVKSDAAIVLSKLEALASARLVVGSAGNVATAVDVTGDVTISNTGVTAIGSAKVLAGMISGSNGARKVQRFSVGYAALNAATTGVAALFGSAIPDNAVIVRAYYDVTTTFQDNGSAGDADSATIKIGVEDQDNDVVAAVTIANGANAWDSGLHEGIQDGTAAAMVKLTAARQLAVTWTAGSGDSTALTAGAMEVFVEYVQST